MWLMKYISAKKYNEMRTRIERKRTNLAILTILYLAFAIGLSIFLVLLGYWSAASVTPEVEEMMKLDPNGVVYSVEGFVFAIAIPCYSIIIYGIIKGIKFLQKRLFKLDRMIDSLEKRKPSAMLRNQ